MPTSHVHWSVATLGFAFAMALGQGAAAQADKAAACRSIHDRISDKLRRLSSSDDGASINLETFQRNAAEICRVMKSEKPVAQASGCLDRDDEVGQRLKSSFESFGASCLD